MNEKKPIVISEENWEKEIPEVVQTLEDGDKVVVPNVAAYYHLRHWRAKTRKPNTTIHMEITTEKN